VTLSVSGVLVSHTVRRCVSFSALNLLMSQTFLWAVMVLGNIVDRGLATDEPERKAEHESATREDDDIHESS
jgi:hypothetical protein